jgi:hypothetical protein
VDRIFFLTFFFLLVFRANADPAPTPSANQVWRTSQCHLTQECGESYHLIKEDYPVVASFYGEMARLARAQPTPSPAKGVKTDSKPQVVLFTNERFEFPTSPDKQDPLPGLRQLVFQQDYSVPSPQGQPAVTESVGMALRWSSNAERSSGGLFHWMAACRTREACHRLGIPQLPPPDPFPSPDGKKLDFASLTRDTDAFRCDEITDLATEVLPKLFAQSRGVKKAYDDYMGSERAYPKHQCRITRPKTAVRMDLPEPHVLWAQSWDPVQKDIVGFKVEYALENRGTPTARRTVGALFMCGSVRGCREIGLPDPFAPHGN